MNENVVQRFLEPINVTSTNKNGAAQWHGVSNSHFKSNFILTALFQIMSKSKNPRATPFTEKGQSPTWGSL